MNNEDKQEYVKLLSFYKQIWEERKHYSEVSGEWLGDVPKLIFFEHLLEKSAYPQFKYERRNVILCTANEHHLKSGGYPLEKHKELINKAKKELINDNKRTSGKRQQGSILPL